MERFKEIFEAYGGDYQTTMERFMGKETVYLKFLDMLLFQDDNMQRMGTAFDAGDLMGAFEAAHTLKGVTGNMGLTPLYKAIGRIIEPLRAGEQRGDYPALYEDVCAEFQRAEELSKALKREG